MQLEPSETHSYIGFVAAGQDAFAVVAFLPRTLWGERNSNSKLADFSISRAKVRNSHCGRCRYQSTFTLCLSGWLPLHWFVGGHNLSCQISQAHISI